MVLVADGAFALGAVADPHVQTVLAFGATRVGGSRRSAIDGWYVFGALVAPVVLAPIIEEGFFRGLMQGALTRWFAGATGSVVVGAGVGAGITTVVVVAVHLIGTVSVPDALAVGVPLVVFALAAGASRALTGRIGAAVIGHVVFNGVAVLLTWPW